MAFDAVNCQPLGPLGNRLRSGWRPFRGTKRQQFRLPARLSAPAKRDASSMRRRPRADPEFCPKSGAEIQTTQRGPIISFSNCRSCAEPSATRNLRDDCNVLRHPPGPTAEPSS